MHERYVLSVPLQEFTNDPQNKKKKKKQLEEIKSRLLQLVGRNVPLRRQHRESLSSPAEWWDAEAFGVFSISVRNTLET